MDETPQEERSPSPEPMYNEYGSRINTREQRVRERLMDKRTVRGRAEEGQGCGGGGGEGMAQPWGRGRA